MRILIAEDDPDSARLLQHILEKAGYTLAVEPNGLLALERLRRETFDALVTDWLMPGMDGIGLVHRVREEFKESFLIVMVTAMSDRSARGHALQAGADYYVIKPYQPEEVLSSLSEGLARLKQPVPRPPSAAGVRPSGLPPFVGVVIAASTGGPPVVTRFFKSLALSCQAAFFLVQHGPPWMLEMFAEQLDRETPFTFQLASRGLRPAVGQVYLAPGEQHLCLRSNALTLDLNRDPMENFVRPAADPLFRSAASVFGRYCVGVVLTGMGRDGTQGAGQIKSSGGVVLVQDPKTAVASSMPQTVIGSGLADFVLPLEPLVRSIEDQVMQLACELKQNLKGKSFSS